MVTIDETVNILNVILLPDSVFFISSTSYYGTGTRQSFFWLCITTHRTMPLALRKNVILSTPMIFFFLRGNPADFDGCPRAGAKALASVSLIPWHPCHSRPALHRRVPFLRCEHSISVSA